uniref:Uncharacterized protein n=1 Tax=Rhizophora mucronata TaxID=61149 RepID=A0A2P2QXH4_RHIMU
MCPLVVFVRVSSKFRCIQVVFWILEMQSKLEATFII